MLRKKGFTLVEIMIVVAIIGIIIAIAIPSFIRARETSRSRACQENLAKIDGAKEQYALDENLGQDGAVAMSDLVGATLYLKREPECPADGAYTVNNIGTDPACDYSAPAWAPQHVIVEGAAS